MKRRWINRILCWIYDFALWSHHDFDLWVSRSESEIAFYQEWDNWLTWNKKDVSHPFMTMKLTSVPVVGWADVPASDWGDFKRQRDFIISGTKTQYYDHLSPGDRGSQGSGSHHIQLILPFIPWPQFQKDKKRCFVDVTQNDWESYLCLQHVSFMYINNIV